MSEGQVLTDVDAGVATITLNRPDRLNAFGAQLIDELIEALERSAVDPAVRAVVITGAGRGFCAGGDLKLMSRGFEEGSARGSEGDVATAAANVRRLERASELLHAIPKVTIAAVNGACAGAGMSLACAADIRVAGISAFFTTAFAAAGQPGDYGLTWLLPRLVGTSRARDLLFLPARIDAAEALRIGIVSRVTADDELLATAGALAAEIASRAPLAMASLKANLNDGERLPFGELLDLEADRLARNQRTEDAREGALAFSEGRPPRFVGR
ncbi:MAG: enoyl-CoA hydratase/isomerase family protein [Acidobacteria bacterium]|nr:enoyl-CoA hydratase/isomerase family protein [Acidobacteriota bacterium]